MKNIILGTIISLIVLTIGCSREDPSSPNSDGNSGGGVMLKIDRENAPSNVNVVTAVLKKGADSLVGNLDLTSSTSADITFQSVPIGTWHLKVDAKDVNNVVIYSGQTSVLVQENSTTQVNLTLVPSATGVGSINLTVTWGNGQTNSEWILQASGTNSQLRDVFFINALEGWAVGAGGCLLKTSNGGLNWQTLLLEVNLNLNSVWFTSQNNGFIVGNNGLIMKTSDGGQTWSQNFLNGNLYEVQFYNSSVGYVTNEFGNIYKTTDGGITWNQNLSGVMNSLFGLKVVNSEIVFAAGAGGLIIKSTNAGSSWGLIFSSGAWIQAIDFIMNNSTGFAVSGGGIILKTTNFGGSWSSINAITSEHLEDVLFINSNTGFIVGNKGTIFKTTNSGENWIKMNSGTNKWINALSFSNNHVWVVGNDGLILKYLNE
jgi:photosystem II stability/assembly factor-like uncharacterized protein